MARQMLRKANMRRFIIVVVIVGLGFVYWKQKQNEPAPIASKPVTVQSVGAKQTPAPPTPAPRGVASEHNWMKRSLDRARDVTENARDKTKQSQDP